MKYWVISDPHLGHAKCKDYCGRPDDCEDIILRNLVLMCSPEDILICLGDVCIGNDFRWNDALNRAAGCRTWLVKGNHDGKSDSWYLSNGWDMVCRQLWLKRFSKHICFTHKPIAYSGYDLNIHGHFHNTDHRSQEPELVAIKNDNHVLVKMEHDYRPIDLAKLCS